MYLTVALDENAGAADDRMNRFLEGYYGQPAALTRARQVNYAGPAAGAAEWLQQYEEAGATHLVLRFAGDPEPQMDALARLRPR